MQVCEKTFKAFQGRHNHFVQKLLLRFFCVCNKQCQCWMLMLNLSSVRNFWKAFLECLCSWIKWIHNLPDLCIMNHIKPFSRTLPLKPSRFILQSINGPGKAGVLSSRWKERDYRNRKRNKWSEKYLWPFCLFKMHVYLPLPGPIFPNLWAWHSLKYQSV